MIWLELPAWWTPFSRNEAFSAESVSGVVPGRMPSSKSMTASSQFSLPSAFFVFFLPGTGIISFLKRPSLAAMPALFWLSAPNSSASSRVMPHLSAIRSAERPCEVRLYWSAIDFVNGVPIPWPTFEPSGICDMNSVPPATTTLWTPDAIWFAAKCTACWLELHWRSSVMPGMVYGQPAVRTMLRARLVDCAPTSLTQP